MLSTWAFGWALLYYNREYYCRDQTTSHLLGSKRETFQSWTALIGPHRVGDIVRDCCLELDGTAWLLCHLILGNVKEVISKHLLYGLRREWSTLQQSNLQRGRLLSAFETLLVSATRLLNIVQLQPSQLQVTKHDGIRSAVKRYKSHLALFWTGIGR